MSKKYIGKLKSFKELMCMADDVDNNGTLWFKTDNIFMRIGITNNKKDNCGKEIQIFKTQIQDFDYEDEKGICYAKEWFSEIKEVEENEVWKPKQNERYCSINSLEGIMEEKNNFIKYDELLFQNYNYWKTQEEAETVEKSMKLYRAMKRWSFDNDNGYVAEAFKENYTIKALVDEKTYFKVYYIEKETNNFCPISVYFSTKEKAEQCLEWLKKEKLI